MFKYTQFSRFLGFCSCRSFTYEMAVLIIVPTCSLSHYESSVPYNDKIHTTKVRLQFCSCLSPFTEAQHIKTFHILHFWFHRFRHYIRSLTDSQILRNLTELVLQCQAKLSFSPSDEVSFLYGVCSLIKSQRAFSHWVYLVWNLTRVINDSHNWL